MMGKRGRKPDPNWEKRFWSKVKMEGFDDCWLWTGGKSKNGYGSFKHGGKALTTSRVAYEITQGDPGHLFVLHTCDNRLCCNPRHLYKGTVKQNSKDMVERGRQRSGPNDGSHNGNAKLTEFQVSEIRGLIAGGHTNKAIAAYYGVTHQMISKIRCGHFWKHVEKVQGDAA